MARSFGLDEESLIYPGYVEEVWPYYATMDVYVQPSRKEGFSLSLLEGMVCGLPVIVSDIPGNNEAVTDGVNGLLFPIREPEKLRKALIEVLTQPDWARELGCAARKTVLENFTVEKISVQFDRVLDELRSHRGLDLPGP
jgi:glycosyltransferase involved in cell wall biosynthesis